MKKLIRKWLERRRLKAERKLVMNKMTRVTDSDSMLSLRIRLSQINRQLES